MTHKVFLTFILSMIFSSTYSNAFAFAVFDEIDSSKIHNFDSEALKLYLNPPISSEMNADQLIIELRKCTDHDCEEVLTRFSLGSLKRSNLFSVSFSQDRWLLEYAKDQDDKSLIIAAQSVQKGAIRPVELCHDSVEEVDCSYFLEKDSQRKGLRIRIFRMK